eukprot:65196_1
MENTPNINRIIHALTKGQFRGKYTKQAFGIDLSDAFQEFVIEEEFEDDAMECEFGDGQYSESFFIDWLNEEKGIQNESKLNEIWNDLHHAFKTQHILLPIQQSLLPIFGYARCGALYIPIEIIQLIHQYYYYQNTNPFEQLHVSDKQILLMDRQLRNQCDYLHSGLEITCCAQDICKILQIGKQNGNIPLLIYLIDAHNRFRIQYRKRLSRKNVDEQSMLERIRKYMSPRQFLAKCKGLDEWLTEYTQSEVKDFKDICVAAMNQVYRKFLHKPTMISCIVRIDDSIVDIGRYICETYSFTQHYISTKTAPLPCHIDMVIIPTNTVRMLDDETDSDSGSGLLNPHRNVENIEERLHGQRNMIKRSFTSGNMGRVMTQCMNAIIGNKRHQRAVIIVDRRDTDETMYAYQPNPELNASCFESDPEKLLSESLFANSKRCLLPQWRDSVNGIHNDVIGISCCYPLITLSFHCFSQDEVRVYLSFDGWCTRFFIEDVKYYLPAFFVSSANRENRLRNAFEYDTEFENKYQSCKDKCVDPKFEDFFTKLIGNTKAVKSSH